MTRARHVTLQFGDAIWDFTPDGVTVDGHQYYFEDLNGWFGGVGVRAESVDRLGHGQFETDASRTSRVLTLRVSVIVPEPWDRDPLVRRMSGILWDGRYGSITVENDLTLTGQVRLDGEIGIVENGDREVVLQIPLIAPDPFLYSPWRESTLRPVGVGVGLEYPLFTGGSMPSSGNLVVNGDFEQGRDVGWGVNTRAVVVKVPDAYKGDYVMRLTPDANAYPYADAVPTATGKTYRISYMVRYTGTDQTTRIRQYNLITKADGTSQGSFQPDFYTAGQFTPGEWNRVTFDYTVPIENAASIQFAPHFATTANVYDIDDFRVTETAPIISYGSAVATQEYVWNDGNADSYPQFKVVGDFPGGFEVGLGDKRVTYPWPTFPDMPVLVDMAGALSVSGVDQSHMLGGRGWASISPASIETPSLEALQGGTGWATVRHRDTYI